MLSLSAELPNGTRISLQRDQALWVATFASAQFVVRPGQGEEFEKRARLWCEGNVAGASLSIAYALIRQFGLLIAVADSAFAAEEDSAPAWRRHPKVKP